MLLPLLFACAPPTWGTWMFTKEVTLPTGQECTEVTIHNLVGAYTPIAPGDDPTWAETDTGQLSGEVFFARVEQTADGAVMIVGDDALPGVEQDDGSWLFYWTNSSAGSDGLDHTTGYSFDHSYESTSTLRIEGTIDGGVFTGTHETETFAVDRWNESDTWSEEAALIIGENGEIPSDEHLLRIDTGGTEGPATNGREAFDCGETGCTLTLSEACAYRYVLTGVATGFEADDAQWVEDAGQPAGD